MAFLFCNDEFDGPMNMALDEVLWLEAAAGASFMRLYTWVDRPVVSLGYFQEYESVRATPAWRGLPLVRRLTGGGAIVHDHEITYSLSLGPSAPKTDELYELVHQAVAASLVELGIPATVGDHDASGPAEAFLCFARCDQFAVRIGGVKVLGSAQRRCPESVLMHGSLLLAKSAAAPEVLGLNDLTPLRPSQIDLRRAMSSAVERALKLQLEEVELPDELRSRALDLADCKYRRREWNECRAPGRLFDCANPSS